MPDDATTAASVAAGRAPPPAAGGGALVRRVPALAGRPRAALGLVVSPLEADDARRGPGALWLKRDDRNAPVAAGNKVRALAWLLGGVGAGDLVVTVGGVGSTHVYATATHATRLGAECGAVRWPHETSPVARRVRAAAAGRLTWVHDLPLPLALPLAAWWRTRALADRRVRWVPFGGSAPLGVLGHVDGALELVAQVEAGAAPRPDVVVVPVGSSGTAAGLLVGFALAGWPTRVLGARCGPRVGVTHGRVLALARRTAALLAREGGVRVPAIDPGRLALAHDVYGGAYGRPHPEAERAAAALRERTGAVADSTYGAKALLAAERWLARERGTALLWCTFDARDLDARAFAEHGARAGEPVRPLPRSRTRGAAAT